MAQVHHPSHTSSKPNQTCLTRQFHHTTPSSFLTSVRFETQVKTCRANFGGRVCPGCGHGNVIWDSDFPFFSYFLLHRHKIREGGKVWMIGRQNESIFYWNRLVLTSAFGLCLVKKLNRFCFLFVKSEFREED